MDQTINDILKRNQLSVTGSRKKILQLFLSQTGALSHGDIEKKVGEQFDRVTIYRTLQTFVEKGSMLCAVIIVLPAITMTIMCILFVRFAVVLFVWKM